MKRGIVLFSLVLALGSSLVGSAAAADAAPAATERLQALDQQILAGLNASRAAHGLSPLVMSDDLQEAAVTHSRAMLEQGFFAHDSPGGAPFVARVRSFYRSAGYNNWSVGENLLYNTEEVTAEIAIAAWLASPAHRENMLTPEWREVGIGSLHAGAAPGLFGGEQTWVITMDFGARSGKVTQQKSTAKPVAKGKGKPARVRKNTQAKKNGKTAKGINRVLPTPAHSSGGEDENSAPAAADPSPADPSGDDGDDLEGRRSGHRRAADEVSDIDPPLEP